MSWQFVVEIRFYTYPRTIMRRHRGPCFDERLQIMGIGAVSSGVRHARSWQRLARMLFGE